MGFGVWGLGFGVWGLGFGVWGLGFRVQKIKYPSGGGIKGVGHSCLWEVNLLLRVLGVCRAWGSGPGTPIPLNLVAEFISPKSVHFQSCRD